MADVVNVNEDLWTTVEPGRTTAVVGRLVPPPLSTNWHELRVDCGMHSTDGGCLDAARRMLGALFTTTLFDRATQRIGLGLRRRLLGDHEELKPIERFVELLNQAARASEHPLALVFDDVRQADAESLALLAELVGHPGRFDAAVVLQFDSMPSLSSPSADVLARVRTVEGPAGLVGTNEGPNTFAELNPVLASNRNSTLC